MTARQGICASRKSRTEATEADDGRSHPLGVAVQGSGGWRSARVIVKPETVIARRRKGSRLFWTWKLRRGQPGRPAVPKGVRDLIRKMSRENPMRGAPRIHGELLKLGIDIGETSVGKYMVRRPQAASALRSLQSCPAQPTRGVSPGRTSCWRCLNIASGRFARRAPGLASHLSLPGDHRWRPAAAGPTRRPCQSDGIGTDRRSGAWAWANSPARRHGRGQPLGRRRSEVLGHCGIHDSLEKDTPNPLPVEQKPSSLAMVISSPCLAGLHHRYSWRQAA